ncbi:hypothetical protein [Brevibacterium jeotgali]|uniref:Uncharacterized protein n=1 Tax=Brevibacterium jeotgali TaxID=1262550 RepID=A0A2H1L6V5_9MICO|nr:hypothetical protein [Brevibacterium jeotgali]TWC02304.1 hypothetical protein FB108_0976 [Brevibacterium jeotgali]SMY12644.1 hypothetical protein BJEO58_02244 [Brevibacterium jeotgali]
MGDADISTIISVLGLAALMFSPMLALLVVPTAEKLGTKKRLKWATRD